MDVRSSNTSKNEDAQPLEPEENGVAAIVPFLERDEQTTGKEDLSYNQKVAPENARQVAEKVKSGDLEEAIFIDGSDPNGKFSQEISEIAETEENIRYVNESNERINSQIEAISGLDLENVSNGKGLAIYKAAHLAQQPNLVFVDSDVTTTVNENVDESVATYVEDLSESVRSEGTRFAKGNLKRVEELSCGELDEKMYGGRVTRAVKALFNLYSDELNHVDELGYPLSGEFGIDRELMMDTEIWSGYGLEMGMLLQVDQKLSEEEVEDVDLGYHSHISQDGEAADELAAEVFGAFRKASQRYNGVDLIKDFGNDINTVAASLQPALEEVYWQEYNRDDGVSPGIYWTSHRIADNFLKGKGSTEPINPQDNYSEAKVRKVEN